MTNGEIVLAALKRLGSAQHNPSRLHTSREVMWEVRRAGFQMTTARAREICKVLVRQDKAKMYYDGRYFFRAKGEQA